MILILFPHLMSELEKDNYIGSNSHVKAAERFIGSNSHFRAGQ